MKTYSKGRVNEPTLCDYEFNRNFELEAHGKNVNRPIIHFALLARWRNKPQMVHVMAARRKEKISRGLMFFKHRPSSDEKNRTFMKQPILLVVHFSDKERGLKM